MEPNKGTSNRDISTPNSSQSPFCLLPLELFLHILDQLVSTRDGEQKIAFSPSNPITRTLRSLARTCRYTYPYATQYLYTYSLYLDSCRAFSRLRRTLGLELGYGHHPDALRYGEAGRHEALFAVAQPPKYITSVFLSPQKTEKCGSAPMIRLPQVIDLCNAIGRTLKHLAMDLQPIYAPTSEIEAIKPHITTNNIFLGMPVLEELMCSFDITDYFRFPPPNLKRMAITAQGFHESLMVFSFAIPSLETMFIIREADMDAEHIDDIFGNYHGRGLDVVLVDVSSNHGTPEGTRDWHEEDVVRIWEVDVPKSYYGDEDDLILCDSWMWDHAVRGALWNVEKRRMESWSEVEARLTAAQTPP
ncbi:hypothetical protein EJ04DRAFT_514694 [Polyplosphaeria fusca]|uniref:Uncharacterized protein n=1 Tax=Polyplosphaeria fusca TaxID=682080 RepID=A0A9P4V0I2_9PLEO|nr:hypothetical protein EJ04DRAFT_514694 [Polyplosphaeria fusca]